MRKVEAGEQKQNPKMQFLPKRLSLNQQMGSLIERIFEPRKNHRELEIRHYITRYTRPRYILTLLEF